MPANSEGPKHELDDSELDGATGGGTLPESAGRSARHVDGGEAKAVINHPHGGDWDKPFEA